MNWRRFLWRLGGKAITVHVIGLDNDGFSRMAPAAAQEIGRRYLAETKQAAVIVRYRDVFGQLCTMKVEEFR